MTNATATPSKRTRSELLVTAIRAFDGMKGDLTEQEVEEAFSILENEFGGDLLAAKKAVEKDLADGMRALAFAAAIMNKK